MEVALVGFKQSGKSTLLAALSGRKAAPGSSVSDKAVVPVPDRRLTWLTELYQPAKTVPATIECLDTAGLSFADRSDQGTSRKVMAQLKTVDMFVVVIRAFESEQVPAYRSHVDPLRDIKEMQSEFLIADLEVVTTRGERLQEQIKKGVKSQDRDKLELAVHLKLQTALEAEKPASTVELTAQETELIKSLGLVTTRPYAVVVNVDESAMTSPPVFTGAIDAAVPIIPLCIKLEEELSQLDSASRAEFMFSLGIDEPAADKFVRACYTAMGYVSFLTVGQDEVRAWPIKKNSSALDAAGKIHSDIKRGFIRAETMSYADLQALGNEKAVRAAGKMRLEGKSYVVQDGDIINFRFNV